jgi:predicted nucleic acid-binding protein
MYLWDSNILRHYQAGHPKVLASVRRVPESEIGLPSIVVAESLRGQCDFALKATPEQVVTAHKLLLETLRMLQLFTIVPFDERSETFLAQLQKQHKSRKRYADIMIAALAVAGRHIVVTRNTKDFADLLPKSQLQNWIDD